MPSRFPILADESAPGPVLKALRAAGWDVLEAKVQYGEATNDRMLLEEATRLDRVLLTTDTDHLVLAAEWAAAGRSFRMLFWYQGRSQHVRPGTFAAAFDKLSYRSTAFASGLEFLALEP